MPSSAQPTSRVELVARFADVTGLPVGTRVVIAGLDLGRVTRLEAENHGTLVWFELREGLDLWSNATLTKKTSSTLGEHYLELDPGTGDQGDDGFRIGPRCPSYAASVRSEALRCREVTTVVEAVTPDELVKRIDQALPPAP
ncbi:MAG: MlaD family protein [Kofleriaceae bacterium]